MPSTENTKVRRHKIFSKIEHLLFIFKVRMLPMKILIFTLSVAHAFRFGMKRMMRPSQSLNVQKIIAPIFEDDGDLNGITLTRYMVETAIANPQLRELESLILSIQSATKTIANVIERAYITGVTGLEAGGGSINVQG